MAVAEHGRLGTSQSESSIRGMSDSRRAKLMDLKKREDLKDALTEKFKGRFGRGARKEDDEMSVASDVIRREVDRFSRSAGITEANLMRLERRLQGRAKGKISRPGDDASSVVSGISGYSSMSKARSTTSLAGRNVVGAGASAAQKKQQKQLPESYDWQRLDEYASFLHEQDSLRQQMGVKALQRKLRMDLDQQVAEKEVKKTDALEEERLYHQNSLMELERWKEQEQAREEEKHQQILKEKADRDAQLQYEKQLKGAEEQKKKDEEASLVEKIVDEMEAEQKKFERKKERTKKAMRKVFEENMEDQKIRNQEMKEAREREALKMKEFNRLMDEQEEQRAGELAQRMERQDALMKKLQANSDGIRKGAGDNDAQRAAAQQEEQDRHFFEAEAVKQNRLAQMRLENQAYLLRQMEEKDSRKDEDKYLQHIQAQILERDTEEYNAIEKQKVVDKRVRNVEHRKDIEKQMEYKQLQSVPEMSMAEMQMNRPLLELVEDTLQTRDSNVGANPPMQTTGMTED